MHRPHGFTIVELLIIIVVVAVLAAISVVAYGSIQTRAKNAKTVNAAAAWIKAIKLYKAENGAYPSVESCLGSETTYDASDGKCWNSNYWKVKSTFLDMMRPYISSYPEPDITDISVASSPRAGLYYATNNSSFHRISVVQLGSDSCPNLGLAHVSTVTEASGKVCLYNL